MAPGFVLARPDVSALPTEDGAWIGNGTASFTIRGAAVAKLIPALLGALTGERSQAEILGDFPAGARKVAAHLIDVLVARNCAVRLPDPLAEFGTAAAAMVRRFAQDTADPVTAVRRLLATPLVCVGRPDWLARLRAVFDEEPVPGRRIAYHDELPPDLPKEAVVVSDGAPADGVVAEIGGRTWIAFGDVCWPCLSRYAQPVDRPQQPDEDWAAATVALLADRWCAGLDDPVVLSMDPAELAVRPHPTFIRSGCRCTNPPPVPVRRDLPLMRRNLAGPGDDPRLHAENERIVTALAGWTDSLTGPFLEIDGGDLPQVPYGQAAATILLGHGKTTIRVATVSSREALYQAALAAVELLAPDFAAGWTTDEAAYRAMLRRHLDAPVADLREFTMDDPAECARMATYLAKVSLPLRWTGTRLANGLHLVVAEHPGGRTTRGIGACRAEAVCSALLRLANDRFVPVNPHHETWAEVWQEVERPPIERVTHQIPFASNHLRAVSLR